MTVKDLVLELPMTEKLKLMEDLWSDLSKSDQELTSPSWHQDALSETEENLKAGRETSVDWEEAKRQLRAE